MTDPLPSGLWGLVHADQAPINDVSAAALGFVPTQTACLVEGRDAQDPHLIDHVRDQGGHTVLTGWIADRDGLARRLGLPASIPPAALARAALERFGTDTPTEMLGEWSLFHRGERGTRWLMQAAALRDRLFFSAAGTRLAFAPGAFALTRLDWIGRELDPDALIMYLGRPRIREGLAWRSAFRQIEKLPPGGSVRFEPDGTLHRYQADCLTPQPRFLGDADEAIGELDATLRSILRERLGATGRAAILLSGGLDSSLLAALAAAELDSPPLALCSVAPPGSQARDEFAFAAAVARQSGIRLEPVHPAPDADPYRPAPLVMAGAEGPLLSNRHCLTSSFQHVARELGATMLVNGTYGEMSVTATLRRPGGLRPHLGAIRRFVAAALAPASDGFHVRIAAHRVPQAGHRLADAWHEEAKWRQPFDRSGYVPGTSKGLAQSNAFHPGALRMDFPYRDLRLLRLFASLSGHLAPALAPDRGIARAIGKEILPEEVRLRRSGMPADPGHYERLQVFAQTARERIPIHRAAGIDDWLDLAWLDQALTRVAKSGVVNVVDANRVQLTALAAEYLTWMQVGAE